MIRFFGSVSASRRALNRMTFAFAILSMTASIVISPVLGPKRQLIFASFWRECASHSDAVAIVSLKR